MESPFNILQISVILFHLYSDLALLKRKKHGLQMSHIYRLIIGPHKHVCNAIWANLDWFWRESNCLIVNRSFLCHLTYNLRYQENSSPWISQVRIYRFWIPLCYGIWGQFRANPLCYFAHLCYFADLCFFADLCTSLLLCRSNFPEPPLQVPAFSKHLMERMEGSLSNHMM